MGLTSSRIRHGLTIASGDDDFGESITSGGAIAPGAALTVDNPGLGAIYPVTVGSETTGIMQFTGAYNTGLLRRHPNRNSSAGIIHAAGDARGGL